MNKMEENKKDLQLEKLTNIVDPRNGHHVNHDHDGHDHGTGSMKKKPDSCPLGFAFGFTNSDNRAGAGVRI